MGMNGFDGALSGLRLQAVERRLRKKGANTYKCQEHRHGFQLWFHPGRFRGCGGLSKPPAL